MRRNPVKTRPQSAARFEDLRRVFEPDATSRKQEASNAVKVRNRESYDEKKGPSMHKARPFSETSCGAEQPEVNRGECKDDELVRSMSNLPGFLQPVKENSVEDKALNFGVLDWKQLEKWKYTERMPGKKLAKTSVGSRSNFSTHGPSKMDPIMLRYASMQGQVPNSVQSTTPQRQPSPISSRLSSLSKDKKGPCDDDGSISERLNSKVKESVSQRYPAVENGHKGMQSKHNACSRKGESMFHDGFGLTHLSSAVDSLVTSDIPTTISEGSMSNVSRLSYEVHSEEATGNRFSDFCSQELNTTESSSVTAEFFTLPSDSPTQAKHTMGQPHFGGSVVRGKDIRPSLSSDGSASQSKFTTETSVKGRAPSPFHRISSMESSAVSESSSFGSSFIVGPMKAESPSVSSNSQRDNTNANNGRGRSSPLRRLLDPLLKHRTAQSSETTRPQNGSVPEMSIKKTNTKGGPCKIRQGMKVRAFLRLTLKNELPLYKLVMETSNSMLVAAPKKMWIPGKPDPSVVYSFFSVQGIKKRSMNWITKGSNGKTCSLAYNMIGQMKISKPELSCNGSRKCETWECILYAVDPQLECKQNAFVHSREIAAMITSTSSENPDHGEKGDFNGTVVILPGGDHGEPISGAPSSLCSRWRSGGSCDCGGWDIGCKLRVLKQVGEGNRNRQESLSNSNICSLKLCLQGQEDKMEPILSIETLNGGLYSIEFDDSVPLLEAFATCVAHLTSRKFPGTMAASKSQTDAYNLPEASSMGNDEKKSLEAFRVQELPAKYTSCPPLSPVGRI